MENKRKLTDEELIELLDESDFEGASSDEDVQDSELQSCSDSEEDMSDDTVENTEPHTSKVCFLIVFI